MSNQYSLDPISEEARAKVLELYAQGIGVETIRKQVPQGANLIRRILREAKFPLMKQGNQIKYKASCPENKVCITCGIEKPKEAFGRCRVKKSNEAFGTRSECKECRVTLERNGQLKRKYGITAKTYDIMFQSQNGLCASCGQPETAVTCKGKERTLVVDHDHISGKVRQLICHRCNIVIGLVKENPDICELVRTYILNHKEG
jgi:hypothetical protein